MKPLGMIVWGESVYGTFREVMEEPVTVIEDGCIL